MQADESPFEAGEALLVLVESQNRVFAACWVPNPAHLCQVVFGAGQVDSVHPPFGGIWGMGSEVFCYRLGRAARSPNGPTMVPKTLMILGCTNPVPGSSDGSGVGSVE